MVKKKSSKKELERIVLVIVLVAIALFAINNFDIIGRVISDVPSWAVAAQDNLVLGSYDIALTPVNNYQAVNSITVQNEDIVYKIGYLFKNSQWESITLAGEAISGTNWILGTATQSFTVNRGEFPEGENYVLVYGCDRAGLEWDCHGQKWIIEAFDVAVVECASGSYRCDGNNLMKCENGAWGLEEQCGELEVCDAEEGECTMDLPEEPEGPGEGGETPVGIGVIFVTTEIYDGNLGGLSGADSKCQASADAAGFQGTWIALMSSTSNYMRDRIPDVTYKNTAGQIIANSKADLFDGSISNPLLYADASAAGGLVWTGCDNVAGGGVYIAHRDAQRDTCEDWTCNYHAHGTPNPYYCSSTAGYPHMLNDDWLSAYQRDCDYEFKLYCINIEEGEEQEQEEEEPEPEPECTDSDVTPDYPDGRNYYQAGMVDERFPDSCYPSSGPFVGVVEQYCENGEHESEQYECPHGCYGGACIEEEEPQCIDTDGGANPWQGGTVTDVNGGEHRDYCNNPYGLYEFRCVDNIKWKCLVSGNVDCLTDENGLGYITSPTQEEGTCYTKCIEAGFVSGVCGGGHPGQIFEEWTDLCRRPGDDTSKCYCGPCKVYD